MSDGPDTRMSPNHQHHGMSQALAAVICEPGVNTTEGMLLRDLLQEAAALGRPLFTLFDHPAGGGRSPVPRQQPVVNALSLL